MTQQTEKEFMEFYEALEDLLPDLKVIITDGNTQTIYPVESFVGETGTEG